MSDILVLGFLTLMFWWLGCGLNDGFVGFDGWRL